MHATFAKPGARLLLVASTLAVSTGVSAQDQGPPNSAPTPTIVVNGKRIEGPELKGVISARHNDRLKVTTPDGQSTIVAITDDTRIRSGGGLFGGRSRLAADALLNGLPVTVKTYHGADSQELVAGQISFSSRDFRTASMIRNGTSQRFEEQAAATESLRGRMGDIDKYNIKGTTNVHFDTGRTELSAQDKAQLCTTASTAQTTENALILVVGYTDSTGGDDLNQALSEKRANRVINYLQQNCGWKPYRMLTPTGMAKADPAAPNDTPEGKAQNRRVAVNILVSKAVDVDTQM